MSGALLIVTGARALADTGAAERWARARLADVIAALPAGAYVLTGGARGPDRWAGGVARRRDLAVVDYLVGGARQVNGHDAGGWTSCTRTRFDPLTRNRVMVERAQRAAREGWTVGVLALVAPWSPTRGTQHTAMLAQRAGLFVDVRTCPRAATDRDTARRGREGG